MKALPYPTAPTCFEIEKRVIGALISIGNPMSLNAQKAMLSLDSECFYAIEAKMIYELIKSRFLLNKEFDFISLSTIIDSDNELFFVAMQAHYYTANMLDFDVQELLNYKNLRKQLKILVDVINNAKAEPEAELALKLISHDLQKLTHASTTVSENVVKSYEQCIDDALTLTENDTTLIYAQVPGLPAIPNRSLITIAGRSGHGKTFFALYLMDKIIDALPGKHSLYFNLEMHPNVMLDRHATILGITGKDSRERIANAAHRLLEKNVSLISVPMITIEEIETICKISYLKNPIAVIVVDYLGLITSKSRKDSKYLEQNDIAKRLAALSMQLDCVVLCLIQVNREFKTRPSGDRCPIPTDAAEAMGSVHSASWWLGIDQPFQDDQDPEYKNVFQVRCRKNRGDSGNFSFDLHFNGTFTELKRKFSTKYNNKNNNDCLVP